MPPGPYPQLLLYPQVGRTPTSASINRMINIVPRLITSSFFGSNLTRFFMKRIDQFRVHLPAAEGFHPWGFAPETRRFFTIGKLLNEAEGWLRDEKTRKGCGRFVTQPRTFEPLSKELRDSRVHGPNSQATGLFKFQHADRRWFQ